MLTVWRKSLLFSCNGFTVFDAEGNLAFRVDVYGSGTPEDLVLMDAAGKPLLTVRRKVHLRVALFIPFRGVLTRSGLSCAEAEPRGEVADIWRRRHR